jgi:hypothetical protein
MRLIQCIDSTGTRKVGIVENDTIQFLRDVSSTYQLFYQAERNKISLSAQAQQLASGQYQPYETIIAQGKILVPLDHPDPYHTWLTGTGLTHLGSAASRDSMHQKLQNKQELTDSMKMFQMGLENGKMQGNTPASQPEWFYKGNGLGVVHPEQSFPSPAFALDGGEEPEIAGLYIIDGDGNPRRLGFALGNEFSDHRMERINYLYLAHSKLRPCSFGPELLLGELPRHITGRSRIYRNSELIWEKEFLTGEENMSHNMANLEYHHFKYEMFRQPGDVHIHFFGTSVLSFADGIATQDGDIFEIEAEGFGRPLRNKLQINTH